MIGINIGQYSVLDSGSIIAAIDLPIEFHIPKESKKIFMRFIFKQNESIKGDLAQAELVDDGTIEMTFTNYNSSAGKGIIEPVKIGKYNNKTLFISFWVLSYHEKSKLLHYTFLLGEEIKDAK